MYTVDQIGLLLKIKYDFDEKQPPENKEKLTRTSWLGLDGFWADPKSVEIDSQVDIYKSILEITNLSNEQNKEKFEHKIIEYKQKLQNNY